MKKNILMILALALFLVLVAGCSFSMSKPADVVEVVSSPTAQIEAASTALSEKAAPTFTPVSSPPEERAAQPTSTVIAAAASDPDDGNTTQEKKPALFFFYADWCSACSQMTPVIDKLEPEYSARIRFIRVNVDDPESRQLVTMAGVRAIPLTLFITSPDDLGEKWVGPRPESVLRTAFDEAFK